MPGPGDRGGKKEKPQNAKGAMRRLLQYILPFRWQIGRASCRERV